MEIQSFLRDGRHNHGWPVGSMEPRPVKIADIIKLVCKVEKISKIVMLSSQKGPYLRPRAIAQYLSCKLSGKSLPGISRMFNRDHTSILYMRNKIEELRKTDKNLDEKLKWYESKL